MNRFNNSRRTASRIAVTGIATLLLAATVEAEEPAQPGQQQKSSPWSADVSVGMEYDSNVAVLELDTSSGEGDYAGLVDLGLGHDLAVGEHASLKLGYGFFQSLHDEFSEFDLQTHRGSFDAAFDLGRTDAGLMGHYVYAGLDGDEFLVMKQISPYVSRLFGERLFVRAAYAYADKDFQDNPERAAEANTLSADTFVFLNGLTTYLVFSYKHDDETAQDEIYDYVGDRLAAQVSQRFGSDDRPLVFKVRASYEARSYAEETPSIAEEREDDRYRVETTLEIPITRQIVAAAVYEYADNQSNLPSVDFDEHVFSIKLGAEL